MPAAASRRVRAHTAREKTSESIHEPPETDVSSSCGDPERKTGADVTKQVKSILQGGGKASAESKLFGDPLPGTEKVLFVDTSDRLVKESGCQEAKVKQDEREQEELDEQSLEDVVVRTVSIGNPGAGKSTPLNSPIARDGRRPAFESGFSAGKGLAEKWARIDTNWCVNVALGKTRAHIDTPGLADSKNPQVAVPAVLEVGDAPSPSFASLGNWLDHVTREEAKRGNDGHVRHAVPM